MGVARVHMAILSFLAGGLLVSISFFMSEYDKAVEKSKAKARTGEGSSGTSSSAASTSGERAKTDWFFAKDHQYVWGYVQKNRNDWRDSKWYDMDELVGSRLTLIVSIEFWFWFFDGQEASGDYDVWAQKMNEVNEVLHGRETHKIKARISSDLLPHENCCWKVDIWE